MGHPPGCLLSVYAFAHSLSLVIWQLALHRQPPHMPTALWESLRPIPGNRPHHLKKVLLRRRKKRPLRTVILLALQAQSVLPDLVPAQQTDILCESGKSHS
ncbi:MAG TPA: hypothetical protein VJS30_10610 [Paraburkholderia sp.]|nr:hypothetical protein [Paraburkholderia sp.]